MDLLWPLSALSGVPAKRAPAAIGRDLLDGYVTSDGATRDYGVGNPGELLVLAKTED
jgi:hypothetical protein